MGSLINLARERGSTAKTHAGAKRYLLSRVRCIRGVLPEPGVSTRPTPTTMTRTEYDRARADRRAARIAVGLGLPIRPCAQEYASLRADLIPEDLERGCYRASGLRLGPYTISATDCVAEILRRVGPASDQALADEVRYLAEIDNEDDHKKGCRRDVREISRARVNEEGSAAILSYVNWGSYLRKGSYADGKYGWGQGCDGGMHHLSVDAYLILRDATSGKRHMLRVPPKFGSTRSATWRRYDSDDLIHAATAWTFGLPPRAYHPDVEA